jgi:hypothetical protein
MRRKREEKNTRRVEEKRLTAPAHDHISKGRLTGGDLNRGEGGQSRKEGKC